MAEDDLVSGEGWVSDDSSLYGEHNEQDYRSLLFTNHGTEGICHARKSDLNVLLAPQRISLRTTAAAEMPDTKSDHAASAQPDHITEGFSRINRSTASFLHDRRAMEESRLARGSKRLREPSPEPKPWNPGQGRPDSWQLGESAESFVRRLPPLTTSAFSFPWIWVHDPRQDSRDISGEPDVEEFTARGTLLLEQASRSREEIQAKNRHGPKSVLTKMLNQESTALQQQITNLAVKHRLLSGKWMLFPSPENVPRVWKIVVEGVTTSRLGPTAKVATDDGSQGDRLICIYTKDFRDEDDVYRVLQELGTMGLLSPERTIYYKTDAFTYLNLYKQTASEYGLQASLHNSYKMMAAADLAKAKSSLPQKKQMTLNNYF